MRLPRLLATTAAIGTLLSVAGCASTSTDTAETSEQITIVASTNVWGDVAAQIGGDLATVTSIISSPSADPHSYEASAQVQLSLSKATIVIENGGGYDDFVDTMLSAIDAQPTLINAVDVSGKTAPEGEELNEHVWYDVPTVAAVATQIAADLSEADPDNAAAYNKNLEQFQADLDQLNAHIAELAAGDHTWTSLSTEPVPGYLLQALTVTNLTPGEFSEAIEEETDVPAATMQETLDLVTSLQANVLVYNEQVTGPQTQQLLDAAEGAGVPVVAVTETMPEGETYVTWMTANADNIVAALTK